MTDLKGSDPSGSDPLGLRPQERVVLDLLPVDPPGLNDIEVGSKLGILPDSVRARFSELYDRGLIERTKPPGEARLRCYAAPPERWEANKEKARGRKRNATLRSLRNLDPGAQAWVIWEMLKPATKKKKIDVSQPCSQEKSGVCDCPDANVYVQRHERRKLDVPRRQARETAAQLDLEWKKIQDGAKFIRASDGSSLYLQDVDYISLLNQIGLHLATRVEDEERIRQAFGVSEIPDEKYGEWLSRMRQYREAGERVEAAIAALRRDDDVLDVDPVDDDYQGPLALPGGYDDDEIVDAEIVEGDPA